MIEGKLDDRLGRVLGEAPTPTVDAPGAPQRPPHDPVLHADSSDCADLQNTTEAIRPLAELCVVGEAQTPFLAGIVGPSGSGKSFALHRLVESHRESGRRRRQDARDAFSVPRAS